MLDLYKTIRVKAYELRIPFPEIPPYIRDNLRYEFYYWQKEAFENLLIYQDIKKLENPNLPTHLMFNMATGTGKTLLMAACILYYYQQGYRHFLFFVNQNNIVNKTENNLIDVTHNKYLFTNKIVIDDKTISIKKVNTFNDYTDDIEIKFTTIQKLHNDIHIEKENQIILEELNKKNIIMIADEAHHLNTETKNSNSQLELDLNDEITSKTSAKDIEKKGWEHTVINLILNKNNQFKQNRNVLLEFTATIPENEQVYNKYTNKIIYKFGLKEFLSAGYTKEINLISSTLAKKERILQALLFNWYREQIAIKYYKLGNKSMANFKPVILFRSKTIEESKKDFEEFLDMIRSLNSNDFDFIKQIETKLNDNGSIYEQGKSRTRDVIDFIEKENISFTQIVEFIKYNFAPTKCIITNSESNKTKTELTDAEQDSLLNSLENKTNHIRAIFTVERLTEGWDVLNLFDIVRLYQGQNAGGRTKKIPEATIKEKQLIGRGVRYYPFTYERQNRNKRKFDNDLKNELRVLEELYYYTYDEESRYISHLKEALRRDGYIKDDRVIKTFKLKEEFKKNDFYNKVRVWKNEQIDNPNRRRNTLADIPKDFFKPYKISGVEYQEDHFEFQEGIDGTRIKIGGNNLKTLSIRIKEYDKHIFFKALSIKAKADGSIFQFNKLKNELNINSMLDLFSDDLLGEFIIQVVVNNEQTFESIDNGEKLKIMTKFFDSFANELRCIINHKIGSEFSAANFNDIFGRVKTKAVKLDEDSDRIAHEISNEPWYILDNFHGTDQEKELLNLIKSTIGNLKEKYTEVYLLRNEEVYTIYDFEKGTGFQPDFILFLNDANKIYYQVFIEPKGQQLLEHDSGKEAFLKKITEKYGEKSILVCENKHYMLIGLPLYNSDNNTGFETEYKKLL